MSGKQNAVVFLGLALVLWQFWRGWQRQALFHGSWAG
jgi:hypothetical protein